MDGEIILEVRGIYKSFAATKALKGVDFQLRSGEVHAIVGENGAGKSTLMNVIDGVIMPDAGEIYVNGKCVNIKSPNDAQQLGVGFVHQEIALCPHMTVSENIFMSEINNSKSPVVNYNKYYKKAKEILEPLANIDPRTYVGDLNISNQQVVEIAKALSMNCKILIFDEPTAALTESETDALFKIMKDLKNQGMGIIYISHRMAEVFSQCDRVTILRDGSYIDTKNVSQTDSKAVVNMMVGRELSDLYPPKRGHKDTEKVLLEVNKFSDGNRFDNISFSLREGEILGLSGLVGAGRSEVSQAICGLHPKLSGEVIFEGEKLDINNPNHSIKNGIVYLTEDRKSLGLFLELSIKWNISAMKLDNVSNNGLVDNKTENNQGTKFAKQLGIKCASIEKNVSSLSGGNQQKILLAKLLTTRPKIIFMDEPTRGIDVGAKYEIHRLIRKLANEGTGIILISSELPEIIGMCDRVLVMNEGKLNGEVTGDDINEKLIIQLASGVA